jgi:hypothetical protein
MTDYTKTQLATRVLKDLGLIGAEETPSAADIAWAEETVDAEVATMMADGINVWGSSTDSYPLEYLTVLSRRIGLAVAPSFGLVDLASAQSAMREAERVLITLSAPRGATPLTLRSDDAVKGRGSFNFSTGR